MRWTFVTIGLACVVALAVPVAGVGGGQAKLPQKIGKGEGSLVLLQWPGYSHPELRRRLRARDGLQDHEARGEVLGRHRRAHAARSLRPRLGFRGRERGADQPPLRPARQREADPRLEAARALVPVAGLQHGRRRALRRQRHVDAERAPLSLRLCEAQPGVLAGRLRRPLPQQGLRSRQPHADRGRRRLSEGARPETSTSGTSTSSRLASSTPPSRCCAARGSS